MKFWGRSSSASSGLGANPPPAPTRSNGAEASGAARAALASLATPPSYVLSEQRRNELLLAARANRVSWIDGLDEARVKQEMGAAPLNLAASLPRGAQLSSHCQEALEEIGGDMQLLLSNLEQLKQKIIPNGEVDAIDGDNSPATSSATIGGNNAERLPYRTLFHDLKDQRDKLERWQRAHSVDAVRLLRESRLSARDKEMIFLLAFQELVALLKHPGAAEFVYQIQTFVKKFGKWDLPQMLRMRATRDRPGGHIHAFIDKLVQQLRHNKKLAALVAREMQFLSMRDELGGDLLHEVLEAFLMEKVYSRALTPTPDAARQDEALHMRLKSLGFVSFRHLDLPIPRSKEEQLAWEQLVEQLRSLVLFVSPRRKMDCVLRVCQDLTTLLSRQHPAGRLPSADEFLPGLIYLLLRANPRELKRNVNFILEYRSQSKLVSEPGYFFTHLVSSVAFLEEVNGSLLTISPEEFEEGLRRSKQAMVKEIQTTSAHDSSSNSRSASSDSTSANQSRETLQQKLDHGDVIVSGETPHVPDILEIRAKRVALCEQLDR